MAGAQYAAFSTSVVFGTTGFAPKKMSINIPGASREKLKTSYMGQAALSHTYIPVALSELGSMSGEVFVDPDALPPINSAAETITITWPDSSTWAFTGFMESFDVTGERDGLLTGNYSICISGGTITVVAG